VRLEIPALTKPVLVRAQFALNDLQERGGSFTAASRNDSSKRARRPDCPVRRVRRNASLRNDRRISRR
jgi:hypothetical protein